MLQAQLNNNFISLSSKTKRFGHLGKCRCLNSYLKEYLGGKYDSETMIPLSQIG